MKKSGFIYGAIILTIINFIVRVLGFSYKIILSKVIGPEGIGLFQMVFPVLMTFITITTAGIPIAVSKLVAKQNSMNNKSGVNKIFRLAFIITLGLSLLLSFIVIFFSKYISYEILNNKDVYPSVILLAPAIIIISLSSLLRGYFYGLKKISPAGISQVVEQITRISFVLLTIYYFYPVSPKQGAFVAIIGISVGELFGLLILLTSYMINSRKKLSNKIVKLRSIGVISELSYIAIPITLSRIINVILQMFTAILIPQRLLIAGYTSKEAVGIFGRVTGMTMPIIFLPFIVTSALVINIIPNLSEEMALKKFNQIKRNISLSIRITLLISIPLTIFYVFFGEEIAMFFYGDNSVGQFISIMGFSTIFLSLYHTLSGILHGLGKQVITTINYVIGMSFQLFATYFLVANPRFGIKGFLLGFIVSTTLICLLNYITLIRVIKVNIHFSSYILKPFISGILAMIVTSLSYNYLLSINVKLYITFFLSFSTGIVIYFITLYIIKGLPPNLIKSLKSNK